MDAWTLGQVRKVWHARIAAADGLRAALEDATARYVKDCAGGEQCRVHDAWTAAMDAYDLAVSERSEAANGDS